MWGGGGLYQEVKDENFIFRGNVVVVGTKERSIPVPSRSTRSCVFIAVCTRLTSLRMQSMFNVASSQSKRFSLLCQTVSGFNFVLRLDPFKDA